MQRGRGNTTMQDQEQVLRAVGKGWEMAEGEQGNTVVGGEVSFLVRVLQGSVASAHEA